MDIFTGSLPFKLKEDELRELFEKHGEVTSVKIIMDRATGQSKGFGFVEMPNEEEAQAAIKELDGYEINGRTIVVNKSEEKKDRPAGGGFRGGSGGGFGGNKPGGGYRGNDGGNKGYGGGGNRGGDDRGNNRRSGY